MHGEINFGTSAGAARRRFAPARSAGANGVSLDWPSDFSKYKNNPPKPKITSKYHF